MKILVIGDYCLDEFIYCKCERLSPEAPVPVAMPIKKETNDGMAGNVAENLRSLSENKIQVDLIHQKSIITKTRFVDINTKYILLRVDYNDYSEDFFDEEIDFSKYNAVVISEYNKGFLSKKIMEQIFTSCKALSIPTFLDTKQSLGNWSTECLLVKINEKEFKAQPKNYQDYCANLVVTLGKDGSLLLPDNIKHSYKEIFVKDQAGLGDSFLAGLVIEYLSSSSLEKACLFANKVSFVAASKTGVAKVSMREVLKLDL